MRFFVATLSLTLLAVSSAPAQVIFANPGLFQEDNGVITQLNTGFSEHNFPSISRDSRFVLFASPDPVTPALQVPPSSDVYAFDRVLGRTRKIIDTTTAVQQPSEVQVFRPVSPAFSPNNQVLAYGLELSRRSGNSPNGTGRTLVVADANTGLLIDEPTSPRGGAVDDTFALEFTGIAWDPSGNSFVTPTLVPAQSDGLAGNLHAIVRYTRDPATGRWPATAQLSTPRFTYNNGLGGFRPSAQLQIFPAVSPSGAGLAYFDIAVPDALGGTQPATARLLVAGNNGAGATIVQQFNPGFFPVGLAWSRDGTRLVFSIAQQIQSGSGYFLLANPATAIIRQISTGGGAITAVPGIDTGYFPSVSTAPLLPLLTPDRSRPRLSVRGRKTIETLRRRVVIRGTARDNRGVTDIVVKARGAKATNVKLQSRNRFKVVLRVNKDSGRVIVKLRAVDEAGNRSKQEKFRILRR